MTNDKGDNFEAYPIYDFEPYNYEEEMIEPTPTPMDTHGLQGKMADKSKLQPTRFRVSTFNLMYKAGERPAPRSPTTPRQKTLRFQDSLSKRSSSPKKTQRKGSILVPELGKLTSLGDDLGQLGLPGLNRNVSRQSSNGTSRAPSGFKPPSKIGGYDDLHSSQGGEQFQQYKIPEDEETKAYRLE